MVGIVNNYRCDICGNLRSAGQKNIFNHAKCSRIRQKAYLELKLKIKGLSDDSNRQN